MMAKERWFKRIVPFLRDVRADVKKVTWPSRKEVYNTTLVVIIATVFFGFYLYFMDLILSYLVKQIESFFR